MARQVGEILAALCDTELVVELGPVQLGGGLEPYTGAYEITPQRVAQMLATKDKAMLDDVTVRGVSFAQSANPAGGLTCNIGGADFGK